MPSQHPEARKLISQGVFDSIKSFKDFEGRVTKLIETNTTLGGDAFEIFVEAYLINQPKMQCAKVFVVKQLPLDISKELNLPNDGKGVDGVYKSNSGVLVPYQVKFRSNRPPLSLTEVATFLGLTERAKDRILITNCDAIATDVKNRDYLRSIRGQDFDLLEEPDFKLIEAWLKEKPVKRELPKPRPYQETALKDIKNTLTNHDRATTVMACGTGKTLVALWAVEQAQANTVLVLLPSLTLMQQTLLEWSKNNSWGNRFSFICVCSDPTVKANDEIEIDPTDIDFKVDTDPELVKEFLSQKNEKVKVVFSTYQSSKIVGEAVKGLSQFDFAIFDEAHKTTGTKGGVFAYALDNQNISIKKRLFLTATPRHYDIKKRDKEGEFKVISMDDESTYGPRAHSLSFGSAANQGIICNYKVIISLIDKNQVDDFALKNGITLVENDKVGTRWVASQIALQQAIEKVNASKIITFHSRVKLAQEFSSETPHGIKRYLKDFEVMHVNGEQRSNERTGLIRQFKDSPKSLITNARCLTEGVDVPAVDMVAFIDARHSKVDIAQAIGRAMRKPKGSTKQFGYIVVPLFADTSDLNNLEETIKKEGFDDVAEILNALQEQDEELLDIIKELQEAKGRGEIFNPKRLSDKVETIGPFINLDEIGASIYTEITGQLGVSWDFWYGMLKKHTEESGTFNLTTYTQVNKFKLGAWISNQRMMYDRKNLSVDRIKKLEQIKGFVWKVNESLWDEGFKYLTAYFNDQGNATVPQYFIFNGYTLGRWVSSQRVKYNKKQLTEDQIKKLNSLDGWVWNRIEHKWQTHFNALLGFINEFGGKQTYIKNYKGFSIDSWAQKQRQYFKKNILPQNKVDKLNTLPGWQWDPLEQSWNEGFNYLCEYYAEYEANAPSRNFKYKNFLLSKWISHQRGDYKGNKLSKERVTKLESLKYWSWSPFDQSWNEAFDILNKYYQEKRTSKISLRESYLNFPLGIWIRNQRKQYKDKKLSEDRVVKLEMFHDWAWDELEFDWNEMLKELIGYVEKYNSIKDFSKNKQKKLGTWVNVQRNSYKKNILSESRIKLLNNVKGWVW